MRILVIDDEEIIRGVLSDMLTYFGYDVMTADNGDDGVRLYKEAPFDLVITDIVMPGKDGLEVVMDLRRDFPDVRIIAVSGGGQYGVGFSALMASSHLGALFTLRKPFNEAQLLAAVNNALGVEGTAQTNSSDLSASSSSSSSTDLQAGS